VELRRVRPADAAMAQELSTDPYVPATGSLPPAATREQTLAWVARQQRRHAEGAGFSFTIIDRTTAAPAGHCGLWLQQLPLGRGSAGYSIIPSARGRGLATDALGALTAFAWTVPRLAVVDLFIEPWNSASIRVAERAGYRRGELLPRHQEIGGRRRDVLVFTAARPA